MIMHLLSYLFIGWTIPHIAADNRPSIEKPAITCAASFVSPTDLHKNMTQKLEQEESQKLLHKIPTHKQQLLKHNNEKQTKKRSPY